MYTDKNSPTTSSVISKIGIELPLIHAVLKIPFNNSFIYIIIWITTKIESPVDSHTWHPSKYF